MGTFSGSIGESAAPDFDTRQHEDREDFIPSPVSIGSSGLQSNRSILLQ
jgi:hypothetical protein